GLQEGGRGTAGSVQQQRFRKLLVGAQVALSVTLLAGVALLITSFIRLSHTDLGFKPQNLWVGFVTLPAPQYPDLAARTRFGDQVDKALKTVSGFQGSTMSGGFPLAGGNHSLSHLPEVRRVRVPNRAR